MKSCIICGDESAIHLPHLGHLGHLCGRHYAEAMFNEWKIGGYDLSPRREGE